ncbi:hypothetical protein FO519_004320 [Halicephalobus sp. NKZ332]|nr:hypothetical protein FO519_004320 [Halicephalobus sp. NKZ332]
MSNFPGFSRNASYTRDGALSPSIEDFHELFPADVMDRLNDDVGDMIENFAFDAYELMNDCTNVSSTSIDRYFPGDNQDEFLNADYVNKSFTTNRSKTIKEEEISMPPGIVKPCYPYACLIALALKNSGEGQLSVADIYTFIMENFPYYQHAQPGWKNSIRHNLSLNKSFEKIEQPNTSSNATRKTYLWKMVSGMAEKMETELSKFSIEDVKAALKDANDYEAIRSGTKGMPNIDHRTPDFASENGSAHVIVKRMNEFFKKEKERKSRGKQSGPAPGSSQSVRQVAEMALGQLLHVKIEVEPPVKCRSRHQSVTGSDPPRRRSDAQCNEGPSTSEHATNSVMPQIKTENSTQCPLETDEFMCSSQRMFC